ncbi:hypothetical protein RN001_001702 [Aquatica leii]|uniref:EF-hand domain-containing protein n=1 Tax=Aquatica leii TaxID=1421715 RepID=A0AAN7PLH4_9COLE|nr:hypothetical protein RN001_001702 [Aquatica leii]
MGSVSSLPGNIPEELLEDYLQLTYLNRTEVLILIKKFISLTPGLKSIDPYYRYPFYLMVQLFPQIKCNPFSDRILKVFSSLDDDHLSFEDMLDLCSIMSENCPDVVKAKWAFQIFDFNNNGAIDEEDMKIIIDRLTQGDDSNRIISDVDKTHIVKVLLNAIDIQQSGNISELEFEHAVGKMPDFKSTFSFRL